MADIGELFALVAGLEDEDESVRDSAAEGLAQLRPAHAPAIVAEVRKARSARTRHALCQCLTQLGRDGAEALVELLTDADDAVRFHVEAVLPRCGEAAVALLAMQLAHGDASARAVARSVLTKMGDDAISALLAAVREPVEPELAVRAVAAIPSAAATEELLRLLGSASPETRSEAAAGLAARGAEVVPALMRRLFSSDPLLREGATEALSKVGGPAVPDLLALERWGAPGQDTTAASILARITGPVPVFASFRRQWGARAADRQISSDAYDDDSERQTRAVAEE